MNLIKVANSAEQNQKLVELLNANFSDSNYLMLLSGESSLTNLYSFLSHSFGYQFSQDLGLVDDRWDIKKYHKNSTELNIRNTGFLGRLEWAKAQWHPILTEEVDPVKEALRYDIDLRKLFEKYAGKTVAIMSIEANGQTGGILPYSLAATSKENVVFYISDDEYRKRISITLECIRKYIKTVVLLIDTVEKQKLYDSIMQNEKDLSKFPVLIFKEVEHVHVISPFL